MLSKVSQWLSSNHQYTRFASMASRVQKPLLLLLFPIPHTTTTSARLDTIRLSEVLPLFHSIARRLKPPVLHHQPESWRTTSILDLASKCLPRNRRRARRCVRKSKSRTAKTRSARIWKRGPRRERLKSPTLPPPLPPRPLRFQWWILHHVEC